MHKNIKLFYWYNLLTDMQFSSVIAILYFTHVSGSFAMGMSIFSIIMLVSAIFELPTGIYSDKIGRKNTIIFESIFALLAVMAFALADSYIALVIGAIFDGIGRSFGSGNNDALLHDSLSDTNEAHKYETMLGKTKSMYQIAAAIAAVLGSVLANYSFKLVMWVTVIPQIIRLLLSFQFQESVTKSKTDTNIYAHIKEALGLFWRNPKLRNISLASMLGEAFGESSYQFRAAFIQTLWPVWAIGIAKLLSNVGATISYYWSGAILHKINSLRLLIDIHIISKIINFISFLFPTVLSPILLTSTSLFYGVKSVAENSLMQKEFLPAQRATMSSLNSLGSSIAFAGYAFLLGLFADGIGPAKAMVVTQILSLSLFYFYWKAFRAQKPISPSMN